MIEYYVINKNSPDIWKKPAMIERLKVLVFPLIYCNNLFNFHTCTIIILNIFFLYVLIPLKVTLF